MRPVQTYINRMNVFLGLGRFHIEVLDLREWPELEAAKEYRIYVPEQKQLLTGKCKAKLSVFFLFVHLEQKTKLLWI